MGAPKVEGSQCQTLLLAYFNVPRLQWPGEGHNTDVLYLVPWGERVVVGKASIESEVGVSLGRLYDHFD